MGANIRRMLMRGGQTIAPPVTSGVIGLNSTDSYQYGSPGYYVNLFNAIAPDYHLVSGPADVYGTYSDPGWSIVALPAGTKIFTYMWNNVPGDTQRMKPGVYHYLWDGAADPVITATGNTITSAPTKVAPGHWRMTISQFDPTTSSNNLRLYVENTSGSPIAMPNEAFVHDDHLALWQSGTYDRNINPDYVAWAGPNIGRFRMAKISGTENSGVTTNVSRGLVTEAWKFWSPFSYYPDGTQGTGGLHINTGMPYSFAAKLCAKMGIGILHASHPLGSSDAVQQAIGAQIAGVAQFKGQVLPEVGNENWNGGYQGPDNTSAYNWLNTTYITQYNAAPYSANLQNGREAEAHVNMRAYKNFQLGGLPANRVILNYCAQYLTLSYGPIQFTLNYVDVGNVCGQGTNKSFKQLLVQLNGAYCAAPYNTPARPDGTMLFNVGYAEFDWLVMTDADVKAFFDRGQTVLNAATTQIMADLNTYLPGVRRLCYEWGHQFNAALSGYAGYNMKFSVSVANSTMLFNVDYTTSYITRDGDQWSWLYNASSSDNGRPNGLGADTVVYLRRRNGSASECYAYTTRAAAQATYATDADAKAAAIVMTSYTSTRDFICCPVQRINECSIRVQAWLDTSYGRDMYQALFANTCGASLWQQVCQLNDVTGYTSNLISGGTTTTFGKAYGLQKSIYADNGSVAPRTLRCDYYLTRTSFTP